MEVLQANSYCMECRQWVTDGSKHECPIKHRALIDTNMSGVADRLYALGVVPMIAFYGFSNDADETYRLRISIDLHQSFIHEVLGGLPRGWEYCRDDGRINSLEFNDWHSCFEEDADARVSEIIKEFEEFLDSRDIEGTRALTLLAGDQ